MIRVLALVKKLKNRLKTEWYYVHMKNSRSFKVLSLGYFITGLFLIFINSTIVASMGWRTSSESAAGPIIGLVAGGMIVGRSVGDFMNARRKR